MRKAPALSIVAALCLLISATFTFAQNANFTASRTFQFDPDRTGGAVAYWKNGIGETDSNGNTNFGLQLEKNVPLSANVAAGAVLNGLKGVVVLAGDTLGYDIKNSSPCGAGSPRFNVSYTLPDGTSGFSFVGGCANGTHTAAQNADWSRVTFGLQNPAQAFPSVPAGATLQSVVLIVDEPGQYTLDDIQFRQQYADKPGNSGPAPTYP